MLQYIVLIGDTVSKAQLSPVRVATTNTSLSVYILGLNIIEIQDYGLPSNLAFFYMSNIGQTKIFRHPHFSNNISSTRQKYCTSCELFIE